MKTVTYFGTMPTEKRIKLRFLIPLIFGVLAIAALAMSNQLLNAYGASQGLMNLESDQISQLKQDNLLVLDVRNKEEYEVSHLKGAVWVEDLDLTKLDPRQPMLVYCTVGLRSTEFGATLTKQGFHNIYNLNGGLIRWKNQGNTVYNQFDQPTDSVHVYNQLFGLLLRDGLAVD